MPSQSTAAALGLIVLLLAVAVPAAISATNDPAQATVSLDDGEQATVTQSLQVLVTDTDNTSAEIRLRDGETLDSDTQTLAAGETAPYELRNETMNVTLRELDGPSANATVAVGYPRTYGWAPGAKTIVDNLPLVLVVVAMVVVGGGLGAAVKR